MLEREGAWLIVALRQLSPSGLSASFFPPFKNKGILLHNHSTSNTFRKDNIDTILLSTVQSIFKFHELP